MAGAGTGTETPGIRRPKGIRRTLVSMLGVKAERRRTVVGRVLLRVAIPGSAFAVPATACSKSSPPAGSSSPEASAPSVPTTKAILEPVTYGYYDGHVDAMLSTDVNSKSRPRPATSTIRRPSPPSRPKPSRRSTWSPGPPHPTSRWSSAPSRASLTTPRCGRRSPCSGSREANPCFW